MTNKLFNNYLTIILILSLIICTASFAGCSNKRDETIANYQKIVEASNEFSKVKNGKFLYLQNPLPFERTIEFIRTDEGVDWLQMEGLTASKYVGDKTYIKEGNEWIEGAPNDRIDLPIEFKQFTEVADGDSKTIPKNILSIMVNNLNNITEYEVHYDVKQGAKETYEKAYKSFIKENPGLSEAEIAEIWESITPADYEPDSVFAKYGVDENNVLVYRDSYMTKGENIYNQKTELVEYNIENFNPFK